MPFSPTQQNLHGVLAPIHAVIVEVSRRRVEVTFVKRPSRRDFSTALAVRYAGVLSFPEQWNAVAEPIILMETRDIYPLAILLNEIQPGDVQGFAATLMFFLTPMLLFSFFEDEVMEGLGDYGLI